MGLPKLDKPLFEVTIPSTGETVTFSPFTVKEEKILLIAKEAKDIDQAILAIKQIITNCVDVDVEKLATFDLEYLLMNLRAKSVSNQIDFAIKDPETNETIDMSLNIDDVKIIKSPDHNPLIELRDDVYLQMQYPKIDHIKSLVNTEDTTASQTAQFDLMMRCIDSVIQGEEVYKLNDFTHDEVNEFLDSLNSSDIQKLKTFFETMPKMRYEAEYVRKDGTKKTFVAEGTETFFI